MLFLAPRLRREDDTDRRDGIVGDRPGGNACHDSMREA
jgi:hypothetical protein